MTPLQNASWAARLTVASLAASGASHVIQGDRTPEHPGAPIPDSIPVTLATADSTCLDLLRSEPRATVSDRLLSMDCRPLESGELTDQTEPRWHWARYRRVLVYGPEDDTPLEDLDLFPDSIPEDELVLWARPGMERDCEGP